MTSVSPLPFLVFGLSMCFVKTPNIHTRIREAELVTTNKIILCFVSSSHKRNDLVTWTMMILSPLPSRKSIIP